MFTEIFPQQSDSLKLFMGLFYHEFDKTIQEAIDWIDNPHEISGCDNVIADIIGELIDEIPFIGLISQILDSMIGFGTAYKEKDKRLHMFNICSYHFYTTESRMQFIKDVLGHENTIASINFVLLAHTTYASKKEILFANQLIPTSHQWLLFISKLVISIFINNVIIDINKKKESPLLTPSKLRIHFKNSLCLVAVKYMDANHKLQNKYSFSNNVKRHRYDFPCFSDNFGDYIASVYLNKIVTKIQRRWRSIRRNIRACSAELNIVVRKSINQTINAAMSKTININKICGAFNSGGKITPDYKVDKADHTTYTNNILKNGSTGSIKLASSMVVVKNKKHNTKCLIM
tara:strand:- start:282 stop:1319 length:1038 start_codon:yes stop_codon:yes gene_type:complete